MNVLPIGIKIAVLFFFLELFCSELQVTLTLKHAMLWFLASLFSQELNSDTGSFSFCHFYH